MQEINLIKPDVIITLGKKLRALRGKTGPA